MIDIPAYTDDTYWTDLIHQYSQDKNKYVQWFNVEYHMWAYFKSCLIRKNRFFFEHPLLPLLKKEFAEHTCLLKQGTEIFRARIDHESRLWNEWHRIEELKCQPKMIDRLESTTLSDKSIIDELRKKYIAELNNEEVLRIKARLDSGFQGFDASGSTAPPSEYAAAGRCNPQGVSYLYAALEEHTAIAEIRPYIKDTISIALLKPVRDLQLVNFDFDPSAVVKGEDFLFNDIQRDFSRINKTQDGNYLVTQFIASFIEHLGYDGLCFRSSLVKDGTNYVIFNSKNCPPISSELCVLPEVTYNYVKCKDFGKGDTSQVEDR